MVLKRDKRGQSEDFNTRLENAIRQIENKKFIGGKNEILYITREDIYNNFDIGNIQEYDDRDAQVFTDGSFILLIREKILMV